jgi:hypothetical protein
VRVLDRLREGVDEAIAELPRQPGVTHPPSCIGIEDSDFFWDHGRLLSRGVIPDAVVFRFRRREVLVQGFLFVGSRIGSALLQRCVQLGEDVVRLPASSFPRRSV